MDKDFATRHLGGTEAAAANWLEIGVGAYREWPERLWPQQVNRVISAHVLMEASLAMGVKSPAAFRADPRNQAFLESMLARVSLAWVMYSRMDPIPPEALKHRLEGKPRKRPARAERDNNTPIADAVTG